MTILQKPGQVADMADEQRAVGQRLPWPQAVAADKGGAHAVMHRGDDVAVDPVAHEQHLAGGAFRGGQHEGIEEGPVSGRRAGRTAGQAEQAVDSGLLECPATGSRRAAYCWPV